MGLVNAGRRRVKGRTGLRNVRLLFDGGCNAVEHGLLCCDSLSYLGVPRMLPEPLSRGVLSPFLYPGGCFASCSDFGVSFNAEAGGVGRCAPDRVVPSWRGPEASPTVGFGGVLGCGCAMPGWAAKARAAAAAAKNRSVGITNVFRFIAGSLSTQVLPHLVC